MTGAGRRRCRGSSFTQSAQDATTTSRCAPTLPRRASVPLLRCAWLGVSAAAAVASFLSTDAEAFVQPAIGGAPRIEAQSSGRGRTGETVMMSERRGLWPQRWTIDLRSDTVTQPTGGMRKAMQKAEVGDDVLGEDPTIKRLEAETAEILGKEAALFVPSGTMANLIAHLVWCSQRGSEMILGDQSHSFLWEQANAAQFGGIGYRSLPNLPDGTIDLGAIAAAVRGNNPCFPVSRLVTIENTQAQCGGKVLPIEYLDDLGTLAQEEGLRVHMDGARIWNAAASSNLPLSRITAGVDSVSVCYSKGLGAPVGSAIVGTADFISRATRVRKALGGGMRQSGVVAAAALEGLRKQLPRIGEDHANAGRLAQGFYDLGMPDAVGVNPSSVQTNIVLVTIGPDLTDEGMTASVVCDRLREKGVLAMAIMQGVIRFVTHSQVTSTDVQRTVLMMKEVLEEAGLRPQGVNRPPRATAVEEPIVDELEWRSDDLPAAAADAAATTTRRLDVSDLSDGLVGQQALREVYTGPDSLLDGESPASDVGEETSTIGAGTVAESPPMRDAASVPVAAEFGGEGGAGVSSPGVSTVGGRNGADAGGVGEVSEGEEKDDVPPFVEQFEEVELQGMAVSSEGFVAIMTSKESPRALKLVVTPDDPMSGGLDVEQAETSEARTLLQLMQGIDVARHLPGDALSDLMDVSVNRGVQLSTVYVNRVDPFSATLMAKVPQRDSEALPSPTAATAAATAAAAASDAASARSAGATVGQEEAWIDGGAAAVAATAAATAADRGFGDSGEAGSERETLVSPSVPSTTMGSGFGRLRVGVSKIAETSNSFEALGLALRYPSTRIFVRAVLLASSGGGGGGGAGDGGGAGKKKLESSVSCFDSADVAELYPNLMKLNDAKTRRSASDDMNTQFEVQKIRQQLKSAMNAGDSDRISALREELNLLVPDSNTAPVS